MSTIMFDMETLPVPENLLQGDKVKEKASKRGRNPFLSVKRMLSRIDKLFLLAVILPTVLAGIYYGKIASDIFVSESRFVIRNPYHKSSSSSGLGALLNAVGSSSAAQEDSSPVHDFMLSRDALSALNDQLGLAQSFGSPRVDRIRRFGGLDPDTSFEALHRYYLNRVTIDIDSASSISTLRVEAFSPEETYRINAMLLEMGERLVNRLNERANQDMIKFATTEVADSEARAENAAVALSNFRTSKGIFDPTHQSDLQLQQVSKIQSDLAATKTQLAQILVASPSNPSIPILRERIRSLIAEIGAENATVAGAEKSFSKDAAEFERLSLDVTFADKQLTAALATLEDARMEAMRQQLYLERIVEPNKPDVAIEPKRLRYFFAVLVLGLLVWGVLALLLAGIREHHE